MKRNPESHTSRDLKTKNSKSHSKDQKSEQLQTSEQEDWKLASNGAMSQKPERK